MTIDAMKTKLVFGTHHKVGTNYFKSVLTEVSSRCNLILWDRGTARSSRKPPAPDWDIYFDHWSRWLVDLKGIRFRGVHCIRNPYSLLYSAVKYHQRAKERWLHEPVAEWGGLSYAKKISSIKSVEEQMLFEMRNASYNVIKQMIDVAKDDRFFHIKLEEISHDTHMRALRAMIRYVDVGDEKVWLEIARKSCLWNMRIKPNHSTTGVSYDYTKYITSRVSLEFGSLFGSDAFDILSYKNVK